MARWLFFALLDGNQIIGMTGILRRENNVGKCIASYIREEYRGQNLSHLLYQARIDWAKKHGIKRMIVGHRASNAASQAANQKFGFKQIEIEKDVAWPDGTTEDYWRYELQL